MLHLQHHHTQKSCTIENRNGVREISNIFEISAYQTSASEFFDKILQNHADLVLDVRLKNESQLCGFTKRKDLTFFVPKICHAAYVHDRFFTPEPQLLDRYLHHWIQWNQYSAEYRSAMDAKNVVDYFQEHYGNYSCVCLIGTATQKRRSHSEVLRGLLADSKRLVGE